MFNYRILHSALLLFLCCSSAETFEVYALVSVEADSRLPQLDLPQTTLQDASGSPLNTGLLFDVPALQRATEDGTLQLQRVDVEITDIKNLRVSDRLRPIIEYEIEPKNLQAKSLTKQQANAAVASVASALVNASTIPDGYTEQEWRAEVLDEMGEHLDTLLSTSQSRQPMDAETVADAHASIAKFAYTTAIYESIEHQHAYRAAGRKFQRSPDRRIVL